MSVDMTGVHVDRENMRITWKPEELKSNIHEILTLLAFQMDITYTTVPYKIGDVWAIDYEFRHEDTPDMD